MKLAAIAMEPHEREQVLAILREHLPGRKVWVFGSRATGKRLKRFSDLYLAIEGTLKLGERGDLEEAFDESLLPFKVDLVELGAVSADFKRRIEADFVDL